MGNPFRKAAKKLGAVTRKASDGVSAVADGAHTVRRNVGRGGLGVADAVKRGRGRLSKNLVQLTRETAAGAAAVRKRRHALGGVIGRLPNARVAVDAARGAADAAGRLVDNAAAVAESAADGVSGVVDRGINDVVEEVKRSRAYRWWVEQMAKKYMDKPRFIKLHPEHKGDPIYYVNGWMTPRGTAEDEADFLATKFKRPVWIVLNPTILEGHTGTITMADDQSEAIYDKTWPITLGAGMRVLPFPPQLGPSGGLPFTQMNTTTRQLTHLIYHASKPIAVVSHSQGCLQMRNAVMTAALFRGERGVRSRLRWVATGSPLGHAEVWPASKRFKVLANPSDPASRVVGARGGRFIKAAIFHSPQHEPIRHYFPQVQAKWLSN